MTRRATLKTCRCCITPSAGPWLADFHDCGYADVWRQEHAQANFSVTR